MQFPVQIRFKIWTFAPKLFVTDAAGNNIGFVRQKLFAFRDAVTIFADETQSREIYKIKADRIIDFNANFHLWSASGRSIGYLRRRGVRSLWRAHYEIYLGEQKLFDVHEQSAFVRFMDLLIGEIPFLGLFSGYFFNPIYDVTRDDGTLALQIHKQRAFLESMFNIEQLAPVRPEEQECALLAIMMMVLHERLRG